MRTIETQFTTEEECEAYAAAEGMVIIMLSQASGGTFDMTVI
jgi:hypothetical protein